MLAKISSLGRVKTLSTSPKNKAKEGKTAPLTAAPNKPRRIIHHSGAFVLIIRNKETWMGGGGDGE